jgi:hypothetical protein
MRANLHLHSRYSDGTLWPDTIAERAAAAGLRAVTLTDHDTMSGTAEFASACARLGLNAIPGVEIDCREPSIGYKSELLAYFPQGKHAWTSAFLEELMGERRQSVRRAVELAAAHFGDARISFRELATRKMDGRLDADEADFSFNKVDVFAYLRDLGVIPPEMGYRNFKRAYFDSRILSNGVREKALCSEVAEVVAKDGGFLVVPHLGHEFDDDSADLKKDKDRLGTLLEYFRSIGVAGIELYQYRNDSTGTLNRLIRKAAKPYGFFFTYGSDCHGPGSGKDTIGTFDGDFPGFPDRTASG